MDCTNGDARALSLDEVFEQLASRRRRYVLYELCDDEHVQLEELARRVAARERGEDADDVPAEAVGRLETSLHHSELPRLHDAKLLEYDQRQCDVSVSRYFDLVEKYLELAETDERE